VRRRIRALSAKGSITGVVPVTETIPPPAGLRQIREGDQNYPTKNSLPSMHEQARQDLEARKSLGIKRYGVALQPANGRDAIRDGYEEALDGAAYGAQAVWEQDNPQETYIGCLIESLKTGQPLNFRGRFVPESVQRLLKDWDKR